MAYWDWRSEGLTKQEPKGMSRPREYFYELSNVDGTTVVVGSDFGLAATCRFVYEGRTYEASGHRSPGKPTMPCVEIPPNTGQVRRKAAAEVAAFLRRRGLEPRGTNGFDELAIREAVLSILASHFEVRTEVAGVHPSGSKLRIDAILRPTNRRAWRNNDIAIGLEFKTPGPSTTRSHTDAAVMAQCLDYSQCDFPGLGEILVLACPLPPYLTREKYLLRFLARYGVGHVSFHVRRGLCLMLGDFILWCERDGVGDLGRRSMLRKTYGNRDGGRVRTKS